MSVKDRKGWPIEVGARVRVRYPSTLIPGREIRFGGWVTGFEKNVPRKGGTTYPVLVSITTKGKQRVAEPRYCRVIRPTREARKRYERESRYQPLYWVPEGS